ncbi:MAG: hypothetical protein ACR2PR_09005 [Pseudohongiellaceae bacterium]
MNPQQTTTTESAPRAYCPAEFAENAVYPDDKNGFWICTENSGRASIKVRRVCHSYGLLQQYADIAGGADNDNSGNETITFTREETCHDIESVKVVINAANIIGEIDINDDGKCECCYPDENGDMACETTAEDYASAAQTIALTGTEKTATIVASSPGEWQLLKMGGKYPHNLKGQFDTLEEAKDAAKILGYIIVSIDDAGTPPPPKTAQSIGAMAVNPGTASGRARTDKQQRRHDREKQSLTDSTAVATIQNGAKKMPKCSKGAVIDIAALGRDELIRLHLNASNILAAAKEITDSAEVAMLKPAITINHPDSTAKFRNGYIYRSKAHPAQEGAGGQTYWQCVSRDRDGIAFCRITTKGYDRYQMPDIPKAAIDTTAAECIATTQHRPHADPDETPPKRRIVINADNKIGMVKKIGDRQWRAYIAAGKNGRMVKHGDDSETPEAAAALVVKREYEPSAY